MALRNHGRSQDRPVDYRDKVANLIVALVVAAISSGIAAWRAQVATTAALNAKIDEAMVQIRDSRKDLDQVHEMAGILGELVSQVRLLNQDSSELATQLAVVQNELKSLREDIRKRQ